MVRVRALCLLSGPTFSPREAQAKTGLRFSRASEPGELSEIDRYQGHRAGPGRAELAIQDYGEATDLTGKNMAAFEALARSLEALRRAGATEARLRFDVEYAGQCVIDLPAELLRKIGDLGLPLSISCFETQETEELSQRNLRP